MLFLRRAILVAILSCIATSIFAEDAPVYDIDNFPPQFDGASDAGALMQSAAKDQARSEQAYSPALSVNQRVARLEQQINNALHSDLVTKVSDLQAQLQSLRGQIEQLTHQLQQLQNQQKDMYADLDKRLNRKIAPVPVASTDLETDTSEDDAKPKSKRNKPDTASLEDESQDDSSKKSETIKRADNRPEKSTNQPNVAEEQQIYQTAYNLIKVRKYNEAATTLQKMLKKYPSGQFAANAHYWLGELYGLMGKNDQASNEFALVVNNYPESPKIADAHLKLGLIYTSQTKWSNAKAAFKKVINHYPGTSWARLASEQLKQLKQAGH